MPAPDPRRLFDLWRPGTEVRAFEGGWLVRLPAPAPFDTRRAPATVLLPDSGRWTSAPLAPVDVLRGPVGSVLLLRAGELRIAVPSELPTVDPSAWLHVADLPVLAVEPLGLPPAPPRLAAAPLTTTLQARHGIGETGARALAALAPSLSLPALPNALQRARAAAQRSLAGALGAFGGLLGRLVPRAAPGADGALPAPTPAQRLLATLERWSEELGLSAALAAVVGQHNASYLRDMMALFDQGRWLEAVERAIPLGGEAGAGGGGLAWLRALGALSFRGGGNAGGGGSVLGDASLYEHLRRLYRRAFDELDRMERTKEAAYVLAELLGEVGEAVAYLEGKGAFDLAAELAEARKLDPGLVVLLWLRAGEEERALAVATVRRAFAAAVTGLERRELHGEAARVRASWARQEASAGRPVAAVEIAWPVPALREEATAWLDAAIAAGGAGGARALAKSLAVRPERLEDDLHAVAALAFAPGADGPTARRALASALGDGEVERKALRAVARGLLFDAAPAGGGSTRRHVRHAAVQAATRCGDGALAADLPLLGEAPEPTWPSEGRLLRVGDAETGTTAVHDVIRLARGRLLVALGDLGAVVIGPDGRRRASFAAPAHHLVPSPDGARVVLVGRRADQVRLSRLDAVRSTVTPWCDAAFGAWADTCDGVVWFVADRDRVVALDASADGLRALWSVDRLTGSASPALALSATATELRIVVPSGRGLVERFQYELPSMTLRARSTVPLAAGARVLGASDRGVLLASAHRFEHAGTQVSGVDLVGIRAAVSAGGWDVAIGPDHVRLLQPGGLGFQLRATLLLGGARQTGARLLGDPDGEEREPWLLAWDDRGRVRALDLASGDLVVDLRL